MKELFASLWRWRQSWLMDADSSSDPSEAGAHTTEPVAGTCSGTPVVVDCAGLAMALACSAVTFG